MHVGLITFDLCGTNVFSICTILFFIFTGLGKVYALQFAERGASVVGELLREHSRMIQKTVTNCSSLINLAFERKKINSADGLTRLTIRLGSGNTKLHYIMKACLSFLLNTDCIICVLQ